MSGGEKPSLAASPPGTEPVTVTLANGRSVTFALGPPRGATAYFVLGIRKCGSTIFNRMMTALATANRCRFMGVAGTMFSSNIRAEGWMNDPAMLPILRRGHVYGGFRTAPLIFRKSPIYTESPKLLLVRDPRDALVSLYFSNAFSHSLPAADGSSAGAREHMLKQREEALQTDLPAYVLAQAAGLNRTFVTLAPEAADPRTRIFRYEDVIFSKRQWMLDAARHFGWPEENDGVIDKILEWADARPATENPTEFVRKVTPGDHREKLDAATIAKLNTILAPAMKLFGYQ